MGETIRMLTGDELAKEVSLVDRGANRRRFALTKGDTVEDVIKAVLSTPLEDEDSRLAEVFKGELTEKGKAAVLAALRSLEGFADELPGGVMAGLTKLVEADKRCCKTEEADVVAEVEPVVEPETVEKTMPEDTKPQGEGLAALPEDVRGQVDALFKEHQEVIAKAAEERIAKAEQKNEELAKALFAERDIRRTAEFVEKADSKYGNLGDKTEVGSVLKQLDDVGGDVAAAVLKLLDVAEERIAKSSLFDEVGSPGVPASGARTQMDLAAQEVLAKSEGKLTKEQAFVEALRSNPGLYAEYQTPAEMKGGH